MKIKLNLKLLNKLTAILVVGCFFISSVCRDAIATAATPTMNAQEFKQIFNDFMLPYSYGKISGSYFAGTDRVVINIQDLHCHPQVQKSISSIIEMFDNKYGISNIYLEGAYGNVSAKPFLQNLINPTQKNEILDKLLESGRLTGAEYYSAISNKTEIIKGLEKKDPYLENLKRFGNLLEAQDQIAIILKGVEESTKKVKEQYYTRRQYKIEKLSKDYLEGKIKAEKYYRLLAKHTEKLGIDLTKYENTFLYMQLLALQSDLNYKAITTQLQTLVLLLKENLPPNAYQILLDNTKNFEQTDKLYAYVIKLSKSFGLDLAVNFKELDKYFSFIELSQRINPLELLKEEENLTREINTRFSDTVAQREVVFLTNFEKYLKDYLSTKITSQDYEYYKENIETYKKLWNKYVDNKVLTLLEPYMKETDKFYKINTDRNNYFTENIFDGIETNKIEDIKEDPNEVSKIIENMDKVKRVDIIITGGFHSQTVSDILKQHGISYIVITPNVQDGVKEAEKTYYQIAKQQKEINFQTLAAMNIFQVYGIEAATTAFIKELKDANISVVDANTLLGNKYNRLVNEIFEMSDEEFENKYGSQQSEYSTNDFAQALITQVAQSLESDDIDISALEKITQIVAKAYGVDDVSDEKLYELSLAAINDEQTDSFFSSFINIFNAKKSDVSNAVEKCLTIRNNTPSIMQSFLNEASEDSYGYDTKKNNEENSGLFYKNKFGENVYLEEYVAEDERTKENLRLNLQNLRDKEEQLRLEKEKEDLEKDSEKNIDKTDKEKQTPTLLDLVTPKFSSKGAAALVTIVATVATLFIPTLSLPTKFNKKQDIGEIQEQDVQQEKNIAEVSTNSLKSVLNPMKLVSKINEYFVDKMLNKQINNKQIIITDGDINKDLKQEAEKNSKKVLKKNISPQIGIKGGAVIGSIIVGNEEHLVRVKLTDNEAIFYSNTINNLRSVSNINEEIEELFDKYVQDGVKNDKLGEDTIVAFVSKVDGFADITRGIEAKQTDYFTKGLSSIHSFGEEEVTLNKCDNIATTYEITTFSVSKTVYKDNLDKGNIDKDGKYKSKYPIIIEDDDVSTVIVEDNQMECVLDFSKGEYDIERLKEIKGDILEQHGINVTVYVKLSEDTLKILANRDIFEETGIIPMVNAEYLENGLTVNGKKGLYNINSERQVKEQTDVVCLIFDKDSEEKLNEELAKKGLFNGVRNIIEQITNIDSPQNKFEYGKDKALSLQVYKLSKDKKVEDIIPELKELLSMNSSDIEEFLKWQGTEPIEKMIKDNLYLFNDEARSYIETRYIAKGNYIEALGFILGVVENSIVDEMINEMFKDKNVDIDKIRKDMRTNEMQGILTFAIYLMLQDKFENKNIIEMLFNPKDIDVNMSAQELYESKKAELLELNKMLDLFLRKGLSVTEKEIKEGTKKNLSDIIEDVNNIIPIIWEDRYGNSIGVVEASTIAMDAFRSMLAAA